jgi:hypothetical protein
MTYDEIIRELASALRSARRHEAAQALEAFTEPQVDAMCVPGACSIKQAAEVFRRRGARRWSGALSAMFWWEKTPQGDPFWRRAHTSLFNNGQ